MAQSIEAEQSVIGACLISEYAFDKIAGKVEAEDFTLVNHRLIFKAISELLGAGKAVDIVTVNARLAVVDVNNERVFVDSDDSLGYLSGLLNETPSAANVELYAEIVSGHAVNRALQRATQEIGDIISRAIPSDEKVALAHALIDSANNRKDEKGTSTAREAALELVNYIEGCWDGTTPIGLSTGFEMLDEITGGGLQDSTLTIIGGKPGNGKTTLAMNIAHHVAKTDPVIVMSMEMETRDLAKRAVSSISGIPLREMTKEAATDHIQAQFGKSVLDFGSRNIVFNRHSPSSVDALKIKVRGIARKHGCRLVVVDYIQQLRGVGDGLPAQLGYVAQELKAMARELNCPVIGVAQLNRSAASRRDNRPETTDLKGSSGIEQEADLIGLIHLENRYDPETYMKNIGELLVTKNRNGEVGSVYVEEQFHLGRYVGYYGDIPIDPKLKEAEAEKQEKENKSKMFRGVFGARNQDDLSDVPFG